MRRLGLFNASLAVVAALAGSVGVPSVASAGSDTTPPTLNLPAHPAYVVGTTVGTAGEAAVDFIFQGDVPQVARWTASDAGSGICGYAVDSQDVVGDPEPFKPFYATSSTTSGFSYGAGNYDSSGSVAGYHIKAYDCAGNVTSGFTSALDVNVLKDVGGTTLNGWSKTTCSCALGGSMMRTSTRNAAVDASVAGTGKHVALIMAKGPARGKAAVYFDGAYQKTVDTYATANKNRVVMWERSLPPGAHTVKVVNLATSGRARVDVDAFMGNY
jgi:hypothetical protein